MALPSRARRCAVAAVVVATSCSGAPSKTVTTPTAMTSSTMTTAAVTTTSASTMVITSPDVGRADGAPVEPSSTSTVASAEATSVAQRVGVPAAPATVSVPSGDVALIGDSITAMGAGLADRALSGVGWAPLIDARSGRRVAGSSAPGLTGGEAIDAIRRDHRDPRVWVVALGTNDLASIARCGCDARAAVVDLVGSLLARIGPGHVVYWVSVRDWRYLDASGTFNGVLRELEADRSIAGVIDWWQASANAQESWFVDSRHLSAAGYRQWRDLLAAGVSSPS